MAEIEVIDDADDFPDEFEIETASGDKIPLRNSINGSLDISSENSGTGKNESTTRSRLEALIEERALRTSICDELYNPKNHAD